MEKDFGDETFEKKLPKVDFSGKILERRLPEERFQRISSKGKLQGGGDLMKIDFSKETSEGALCQKKLW